MYSKTERNVIPYLMQGLSSMEIGDRLGITEKTVKFHLTNIYKKAGVKNRIGFIAKETGNTEVSRENIMTNLDQGKRVTQIVPKSQEEKIQFIDDKFQVGSTIGQLHKMMKEVTKDEITPNTVNAACNCVARLNETINTAIQAARFLNEK